MEILNSEKSNLVKAIIVLMIILSLYFLIKTFSEIKNYSLIGAGTTTTNTISFNGKGEVTGSPDLATISFTILEGAPLVKDAQNKVTAKETAVLDFLNKSGIAKSDIKTENYNSFPKYQFQNAVCPQVGVPNGTLARPVFCPPGKQILTGYEVSENISVKVHDVTKAGAIVQGIGAVGVSDMNGPNFSIENEDKLKEQARKIAIDDAKIQAKTLSSDLGVSLIRIVNFSENGNTPIFFAQGLAKADSAIAPSAAPAPAIPIGENKITSNVTITYEIR
jgi:uncharacterized protein YggE